MKKMSLPIVLTMIIVIYYWPSVPQPGTLAGSNLALQGSPRLAELLGAGDPGNYSQALEQRQFQFPQDHGPHGNFRNEWWYLTGNLDSADNRRFGFELTLFRFSVAPGKVSDASAWRSNQVFVGHLTITDVSNAKFHVAQRYSRGALDLAGAQAKPLRVWLDDWELSEIPGSVQEADTQWRVKAHDDDIALDLTLSLFKPPVLNGENGLSQKSASAGNASYYYSVPRIRTNGRLRAGAESYDVSGLSWLDREWGSSGLSKTQRGWDWFALQLSDGSDLMFYNLRRADGMQDEHSAGTYVSPDGKVIPLTRDDVTIDVLDYWVNPNGARYPMGWRLALDSLDLDIVVTPVMREQELPGLVRYWEGAVDAEGDIGGNKRISGRGYVELTGYAEEQPDH
jgi:predicted secreted hydrolase